MEQLAAMDHAVTDRRKPAVAEPVPCPRQYRRQHLARHGRRFRSQIRGRDVLFLSAILWCGSDVTKGVSSLTPTGSLWANMGSKIASAFKHDKIRYRQFRGKGNLHGVT